MSIVERLIKPVVAALSAVIAVKLVEYLSKNSSISPLTSIIIAGCVAAVFGLLCDETLSACKRRFSFIRRQVDSRAKFEGIWLITVMGIPERPYAYACIEFNPESDTYSYRGAAFDVEGELAATWMAARSDIDTQRNEMRFVTSGQVVDKQGEQLHSYGIIQFDKELFGRRRFTRGKGFFVDLGTHSRKAHFVLDRISSKDVVMMIGKKEVITHEDMSALILAYHRRITTKATGHGRQGHILNLDEAAGRPPQL